MRKKFGAICMIVGAVLLISAFALLIYNQVEASRAKQLSTNVISQLKDSIVDNEKQTETSFGEPSTTKKTNQMSGAEIDGYSYIGYLGIPSQGLELPVMSSWDYQRLRVAPCRYSGTISEKNLVVIAHNYSSHFGNLDQLELEDEVLFTDMKGVVTKYRVACVDVVPPTSAGEVVAGAFDLALVTCTYSGKTRLVVYCDEKL